MKSTSSTSFIIAILLYSALLLAGYWLFSLEVKNEIPLEKTRVLPVSLNMFQPVTTESTPTEAKPVKTPVEESAEPKIEPVEAVEPKVEPKTEAKTEPKVAPPVEAQVKPPIEPAPSEPLPKPEPIIEKKPTPAPSPTPKPEPKPVKKPINKPEPIIEKPTEPVEKPLAKAAPTPPSKPSPPVTRPKSEAQPITPQVNSQVSAQQRASAEQAYLSDLRNEISRHAQDTYPRHAKRRRWEGVVTLSFTLLPNGKIVGLTIQESSGRQILDSAAMSIVQSKMRNQFQEFPSEINRKEWKITIPVSYNLR